MYLNTTCKQFQMIIIPKSIGTQLTTNRCIIYTMCYCRSQMCNVMQVDNALYLNSNRTTQEGMNTQYRMGRTCSRKTSSQLSKSHEKNLKMFFHQAIQNEWVLGLIVDNFTKVHTYRRPATSRICNPHKRVYNCYKSI